MFSFVLIFLLSCFVGHTGSAALCGGVPDGVPQTQVCREMYAALRREDQSTLCRIANALSRVADEHLAEECGSAVAKEDAQLLKKPIVMMMFVDMVTTQKSSKRPHWISLVHEYLEGASIALRQRVDILRNCNVFCNDPREVERDLQKLSPATLTIEFQSRHYLETEGNMPHLSFIRWYRLGKALRPTVRAVSYTHLTLPTIYSV